MQRQMFEEQRKVQMLLSIDAMSTPSRQMFEEQIKV